MHCTRLLDRYSCSSSFDDGGISDQGYELLNAIWIGEVMFNKTILVLLGIFALSACGGGGGGSGGSGDGDVLKLPTTISWNRPLLNTDNSTLEDLSKYRFYYGPDADSLQPMPLLDFENPGTAESLSIDKLTLDQIDYLTNLVESNTTHWYAMTAINSQNMESSLSNIAEYKP